MVAELFTVVALPRSRAADADAHVSVFVAPRLTPDGDEGTLADFTHFPRWAHLLADDATISLADQAGPLQVRALRSPIEPDLFDAVLPPETPVRAPGTLDWSDRHWRTFPAAELHDAATALHALAMFSGPTAPPAPSSHPLTRLLDRLGVRVGSQREPYDESRFTARYDQMLAEWPSDETIAIGEIESMVDGLDDPIVRLAVQLHRARRFYERPEAQREYRDRPDPDAVRDPLPRPDPDVHERCTLVGDHPGLQRRLGLVIDLEVRDRTRLAASQWLAARIVPSGDEAACRSPRTRVATAGDDLVTVPRTADWHAGRLRLGDVERFTVLDVDPDGAALKLERFLWTLPRLAAIERNGDPVHAAPAALRSLGFTVVQRRRAVEVSDQMAWQRHLAGSGDNDRPMHLATEDVTQGLRVEVWDDEVGAWYSLHRRRIDVEVAGLGEVAADVTEEGFVQGATATETPGVEHAPVHVHESVFGWDGWSLAAPRPGARVRHEDGDEVVEDPDTDPDPVTPLTIHTRVEPGTLPRLRYGRSYAFRAWSVDLAGNSRPHPLGPVATPSRAVVSAVASAARDLPAVAASPPGLLPLLRGSLAAAHLERDLAAVEEREATPADEALRLLGAVQLDRPVLSRLRARRGEAGWSPPPRGPDRTTLVARRFTDVLTDEAQPVVAPRVTVDPGTLARALGPTLRPAEASTAVVTVTPLRPFLRWHPVEPPALVPKRAYSAGESLRHLVIRSGVRQDPVTLEITVTPPDRYAADLADLGYHPTAERHVAPPKTSQSDAELHGEFDDAIGSNDPAAHARLLAVALRESGTFFDVAVPRLDDPAQTDPQPGIELAHDPGVPPSELATRTLPLPPGEPPVPGQYIVHDVDQLRLPYLPDVLARGISLVFPDAGRDRRIAFPFGTEGFTARYVGGWPEVQPIRLVLTGSDELDGHLDDGVLTLALPAGDVQRFRLASSMDPGDLRVLGPWRLLPTAIRDDEAVADAAADGWLWALSPFDEVTLVHAVPRPLEAPRPTRLVAHRVGDGSDEVALIGAVDVHGPSTEQLTAEAVWTDPIDDLTLPTHELRTSSGVAFTTSIREEEDLALLLLLPEDQRVELPGDGPVWIHRAVHHIGDTRHHQVRYRFRAATRFREYFDAAALAPGEPTPDGVLDLDDGQSVVGPEVTLSVPSSARPAPPIVHSVVPLFRWDEGSEPEQPVARRHRRRAGVRIYLERPWFSSGERELLGVLLAPGGDDAELGHLVSQWGTDPAWLSSPIDRRALSVELDSLLRVGGLDDRPGSARPVVPPATLPLGASPGWPQVTVLGYRPQYNLERGLWYVDVAVDAGDRFWPFVRLSVARYQPASLHGCHLSAAVRCDFVQLTPERTTSVSRTDLRHVRVVVSGPVGLRTTPHGDGPWFPSRVEQLAPAVTANRKVVARLQRRDPAIPTDLGWETVTATELVVRGHGRTTFEAAWVGSLEADRDLPLRRPKDDPDWRVTVEEWERLPGDPADLAQPRASGVWEQRLVYADEVHL